MCDSLDGGTCKGTSEESRKRYERPRFGLLESVSPEVVEKLEPPRIFTTHLKPRRLPTAFVKNRCKVVLFLRNPKDVAVSFYHHLKASASFSNPQDWDEYFESFVNGIVPWGSYFDYLREWEDVIQQSRAGDSGLDVEVFYYEDLKGNILENLRRLNNHIGQHPRSDDELMTVADHCSFSNMTAETNANKEQITKGLRKKDGTSVIFRKGEVGDWKNHFTVAQNERFEQLIESRLGDSMFYFKYTSGV